MYTLITAKSSTYVIYNSQNGHALPHLTAHDAAKSVQLPNSHGHQPSPNILVHTCMLSSMMALLRTLLASCLGLPRLPSLDLTDYPLPNS